MIKDGIKKLATKTLSEQDWDTSTGLPFNEGYLKGFKHGFKKSRETYKFTEENMVEFAMNMISQYQFGNTNIHNRGILMESLPKKELWVEVELSQIKSSDKTGYTVEKLIPKITDNTIKGQWK